MLAVKLLKRAKLYSFFQIMPKIILGQSIRPGVEREKERERER